MDSAHKFEVLKGLKILMKLVELYPANWYIWKFRISIPLIFRTLVLNMILFLYTTLWLCYSYDWNLKLISGSVCFVFGVLFLFNSHFSMMYSKSIIVDSVTLLQQLVEQRKIYRIFFLFFEMLMLRHLNLLAGCAKSLEAYEIYQKNEAKNMKILKFICLFVLICVISLCVTTGSLPIFYLLFGYPAPEKWFLSLPTKQVQ